MIFDSDPLDYGSNDLIDTTRINYANAHDNDRKIMRRDIERKRRQEMGDLFTTLRSQLPLEYVKGKRSVTDLINEAVNYIKNQQENIKELTFKRDFLKNKSSSSALTTGEGSSRHSIVNCVIMEPCLGGLKIVFSSGFDEQGPMLSRVMAILFEEGLTVVSYVSTKVKDKFLHTIQSEVEDRTCINLPMLQQKLQDVVVGP